MKKHRKKKALLTLISMTISFAFLCFLVYAWLTYHDAWIFYTVMSLSLGYPICIIMYNKYVEHTEKKRIRLNAMYKRKQERKSKKSA